MQCYVYIITSDDYNVLVFCKSKTMTKQCLSSHQTICGIKSNSDSVVWHTDQGQCSQQHKVHKHVTNTQYSGLSATSNKWTEQKRRETKLGKICKQNLHWHEVFVITDSFKCYSFVWLVQSICWVRNQQQVWQLGCKDPLFHPSNKK